MKVNPDLASASIRVPHSHTTLEATLSASTRRSELGQNYMQRQPFLGSILSPIARRAVMMTIVLSLVFTGQVIVSSLHHSPLYAQQTTDGYYYTVQIGDSWGLISDLTGVSVTELQEVNPDAVRYNQWLRVGERLFIPGAQPSDSQTQARTHIVKAGESWSIIAAQYELSSRLLKSVNPSSIRDGDVLYLGEQLTIPGVVQPSESADTTDEPSEEAAPDEASAEESAAAAQPQTRIVIEEHQVGGGDSWSIIAAVYGVSIDELKAANPSAVRENDVLYFGETLSIPTRVVVTETEGEADSAASDETGVLAEVTPVAGNVTSSSSSPSSAGQSAADDVASNADDADSTAEDADSSAAEIPAESSVDGASDTSSDAVDSASGTSDEADSSDVVETDIEADADEATGTDEADSEEAAGEEATGVDEADGEVSDAESSDETGLEDADSPVSTAATELEFDETGCPVMFSQYAEMIEMTLTDPAGNMASLEDALVGCSVSTVTESSDWTADGVEDTLIILQNQESEFKSSEGDILIFNGLADGGYELAYQARSAGEVELLSNEDINKDGQADITWTDTTCGASTCFSTVNVRSWSNGEWQDWTDGTLTMAYPDIVLEDINDEGQSSEIVLSGGIYGSAAAGPQRSRTEVWGSVDGSPYAKLETNYDESPCLYFTVIDGNKALMEGTTEGFAQAKELYEEAVSNTALTDCWDRENEEVNLRSFSQFRLALIAAYSGEAEAAATQIDELNENFPDSLYAGLGEAWLTAYQDGGDVTAACEAGNAYAEENPDAWSMLADFGYFNPSFSASEVCPILDIEATEAISRGSDAGAADAESNEVGGGETDTDEADSDDTDSDNVGSDDPESDDADSDETDSDETDSDETDTEEAATSDADTDSADSADSATVAELPACPEALDGFVDAAADALTAANGDATSVEEWMRSCDALTEERGALINYDMNGDGANDFILFPTLVSEDGYGPDGTEGLVLIYHAPSAEQASEDAPEFELTAGPNVFGKPVPIGIDDYNLDDKIDLAFTVEGCSTFCIDEVQILSWNGEVYVVSINPGATIAEGTVSFAPVADDDLGQGQSVVLIGGVSGTPEGGLNVPHEEIWQSIDGKPYERIRWTYDREAEGANCLGLRLIEADVALQSAPMTGYDEAIDLYTASIDPTLEACSIQGISAAEELILLQGLASFRLVQAHALSGDLGNANTILDAFSRGQPDGVFTAITSQWLETFNSTGDAVAACDIVLPLIEEDEQTWQITDHYGYNHPSLAAQQICFMP